MILNDKNINKLELFLEKIKNDIPSEPHSDFHINITYSMFEEFINDFNLGIGDKVLDIGCGQGVALLFFDNVGMLARGITQSPNNLALCQERNLNASLMNYSFLDFENESFDVVWCRHVLQLSTTPYFDLSEIYRVLKSPGYLYLEVPAPNTVSKHESKENNYSVFDKNLWDSLLTKTGFEVVDAMDIDFNTALGPDKYYSFFIKK